MNPPCIDRQDRRAPRTDGRTTMIERKEGIKRLKGRMKERKNERKKERKRERREE